MATKGKSNVVAARRAKAKSAGRQYLSSIEITPEAASAMDGLYHRTQISKKALVSTIISWFCHRSWPEQLLILYPPEKASLEKSEELRKAYYTALSTLLEVAAAAGPPPGTPER